MIQIRLLSPADAPTLRAYLAAQADWRLMMLNNLDRAEIGDGDAPYGGIYAGRFDKGDLIGCLGLFWNGMVLSHTASGHGEMLALVLARATRKLAGVTGPIGDVEACIAAIAERNGMPRQANRETLFAVKLAELKLPEALRVGSVTVNRAQARDRALAVEWRIDMLAATRIGQSAEAMREQAEIEIGRLLDAGLVWVAKQDGIAVAQATTIALAEGRACVGGVWTPAASRNQGFARAVVAGQLRILESEGIERGVLFTGQHNGAAISAYKALGFAELGAWGMAFYG